RPVSGLTALVRPKAAAWRGRARRNRILRAINQVAVDVGHSGGMRLAPDMDLFEDRLWQGGVPRQADDDAMDRRFASRLVVPLERPVSKEDRNPSPEEARPENSRLLALGYGVGGDEGDVDCPVACGILDGFACANRTHNRGG